MNEQEVLTKYIETAVGTEKSLEKISSAYDRQTSVLENQASATKDVARALEYVGKTLERVVQSADNNALAIKQNHIEIIKVKTSQESTINKFSESIPKALWLFLIIALVALVAVGGKEIVSAIAEVIPLG